MPGVPNRKSSSYPNDANFKNSAKITNNPSNLSGPQSIQLSSNNELHAYYDYQRIFQPTANQGIHSSSRRTSSILAAVPRSNVSECVNGCFGAHNIFDGSYYYIFNCYRPPQSDSSKTGSTGLESSPGKKYVFGKSSSSNGSSSSASSKSTGKPLFAFFSRQQSRESSNGNKPNLRDTSESPDVNNNTITMPDVGNSGSAGLQHRRLSKTATAPISLTSLPNYGSFRDEMKTKQNPSFEQQSISQQSENSSIAISDSASDSNDNALEKPSRQGQIISRLDPGLLSVSVHPSEASTDNSPISAVYSVSPDSDISPSLFAAGDGISTNIRILSTGSPHPVANGAGGDCCSIARDPPAQQQISETIAKLNASPEPYGVRRLKSTSRKSKSGSRTEFVFDPNRVPAQYLAFNPRALDNNVLRRSRNEEPVLSNLDISTGHMILSYMEEHLTNHSKLDEEWTNLSAYHPESSSIVEAHNPKNATKNRVSNLVPYDHSRVKLNESGNHNGSDYINASIITDHDPRNPSYVVCQGPLEETVEDMWQMVWEEGAVVLVNLTRLNEDGADKSWRYWPKKSSEVYHSFEVHLVSEHIWCEDYVVRSFYLKNLITNETRTVTQFHFLTWPDHGIPSSSKALLEFRRKVNKSYRGRSCPIIVHCSDGSGRSGTYCLLDMVLNRINKGVKQIDIAATLEHLRDQRMGMVETKDQFEYVLTCVAEEVQAILKALPQQG